MFKGLAVLAAGEVGGALKRQAIGYALIAGAVVVGLVATVFALVALRDWLTVAYVMTNTAANLWIAGGLVLVALALVASAAIVRSKKSRTSPVQATALVAAPLALQLVTRNFTTAAVAAVVVAGALLGRRIARD